MKNITRLTLTAFALTFVLAAVAFANEAVNTDKTGVAIGGYCPIAYFTLGEPRKGDFQIASEHDGATYWFMNEEHKAEFEKNPEKYVPAYGGYCAYGVAVGAKFHADPHNWSIIDGRLYLNMSDSIQETFNADLEGNLAKAEENWPKIKDEPAGGDEG